MRRRTLLAALTTPGFPHAMAQPTPTVTFPPGARMGLRVPPGMALSPRFWGYAEPGLPATTHPVTAPTLRFDENPLEPASRTRDGAAAIIADHGTDVTASRIVPHPDGFATLHHGIAASVSADERARVQVLVLPQPGFMGLAWFHANPGQGAAYPPDVIDAALLSVRIRPQPSLADRIAALGFTMADLADFTVAEAGGIGGFTLGVTMEYTDAGPIVEVYRQWYEPIPVPPGRTPGQALQAAFPRAGPVPPRFNETIGTDGWWTDALYEQSGEPTGLPWTIEMKRYAPNGYLQVSVSAHPRDRDTLLPRLLRLFAGLAPR